MQFHKEKQFIPLWDCLERFSQSLLIPVIKNKKQLMGELECFK